MKNNNETQTENNELIEYAVSEIKKVFREYFCLSEKDIQEIITKILETGDENLILELSDLYGKFVNKDTISINKDMRRKLAKSAVNKSLQMYLDEKVKIKDEFFAVLKRAKALKIDPFTLANKTNFRTATVQGLRESLLTLMKHQYQDLQTGEKFTLFTLEEVRDFVNSCASCVFAVNKANIQNVLDQISMFFYDEQANQYAVSPKEVVKKVKTLLVMNPAELESNIEFLMQNFVSGEFSKAELIQRVALAPSILAINPNKIKSLESELVGNLMHLMPDGEEERAFDLAHKCCYDLDKLTVMTKLKNENITNMGAIREILVKHFGKTNAIKCITDMNFLSMDPAILDCLLCKIAVEEKETKMPLREFLIKHPGRGLNIAKSGESLSSAISQTGEGVKRHSKKKKGEVAVEKLPDGVSKEDADLAYSRLSAYKKKAVDALLDNVKSKLNDLDEDFEYIHNLIEEPLSNVPRHSEPYVEIIERISAALDAKHGDGYADKNFSTKDLIKIFKVYKKRSEISVADVKKLEQLANKYKAAAKEAESYIKLFMAPESISRSVQMRGSGNLPAVIENIKNCLNEISRFADVVEKKVETVEHIKFPPSLDKSHFVTENFFKNLYVLLDVCVKEFPNNHHEIFTDELDYRFTSTSIWAFDALIVRDMIIDMERGLFERLEVLAPGMFESKRNPLQMANFASGKRTTRFFCDPFAQFRVDDEWNYLIGSDGVARAPRSCSVIDLEKFGITKYEGDDHYKNKSPLYFDNRPERSDSEQESQKLSDGKDDK